MESSYKHIFAFVQEQDPVAFGTALTRTLNQADQIDATVVAINTFIHASDRGGTLHSAHVVWRVNAAYLATTYGIPVSRFTDTGGFVRQDEFDRLLEMAGASRPSEK